ncbi:MAG: winged helix-turn-helix domain-containing protein, partial [Coriobacteriales bacterium]|nr:winged helix-turn-helix domain-containing protein [Coriobacteriales bacterium]
MERNNNEHRKHVVVSARQPELINTLQAAFTTLDAETRFISALPLDATGVWTGEGQGVKPGTKPSVNPDAKSRAKPDAKPNTRFDAQTSNNPSAPDLIILETDAKIIALLEHIENSVAAYGPVAMMFVLEAGVLPFLHLPQRLPCDFIVKGAPSLEYQIRARRLLWPHDAPGADDVVESDGLVINLASYQVSIDGKPLALTTLEYSLLTFLVTHADRAYPRDALLRRIWGYEYYGGARTVDVHVRRLRAKLGEKLSAHIKTIRGVGYMWA